MIIVVAYVSKKETRNSANIRWSVARLPNGSPLVAIALAGTKARGRDTALALGSRQRQL